MLKRTLLVTLALGIAVTPAPAALAHVPGEVQLVSPGYPGETFWAEHTIRHGDGSWDPFGRLDVGGPFIGPPLNLAATVLNGQLNLVYGFLQPGQPHKPDTLLQIRHADGTWSKVTTPFTRMWGPLAVAAVNGELHLVHRVSSTEVRLAVRHANGSWSEPTIVPLPQDATGFAAVNTNNKLEVLAVQGEFLVSTTLLADGTWSPATRTTTLPAGTTASSVDATRVGADLQVVVKSTQGVLLHAIRNSTGTWSRWGDVGGQTGVPGEFDAVAVTPSRNTMHIAVTTKGGGLFHSIRFADGTWQRFGDVHGAAPGGTRSFDVAIAGD